jgi:chaperone required for assembly of F1-ATPase
MNAQQLLIDLVPYLQDLDSNSNANLCKYKPKLKYALRHKHNGQFGIITSVIHVGATPKTFDLLEIEVDYADSCVVFDYACCDEFTDVVEVFLLQTILTLGKLQKDGAVEAINVDC